MTQERIKTGGEEVRVTAHPGCGPGRMVGLCLNILFTVRLRGVQVGDYLIAHANRELISHASCWQFGTNGFILNLGTSSPFRLERAHC